MTTRTRRVRGTGGLYKRASDGMWVAAVTLPPGPDGKRRRKVVARAKKSDVVTELRKLREQLERAGDLQTTVPTLANWVDAWWERYGNKRLKVGTRPSYASACRNYIVPVLGRYRLDQIGPEHVHRLHDYITDTQNLSSTTALNAHRVLSVILRDAIREGKISRNPCALVDAPKKAIYRAEYLDGAQARTMLGFLDPGDGTIPLDLAMAVVGFLAGPRQGERLGITRDAIDFDKNSLTISWQLQRLKYEHGCGPAEDGKRPCGRKRGGDCTKRRLDIPKDQEAIHLEGGLYLTRPKSRAGWREFPMVGLLAEVMRAWVDANEPGMHGLLFTRDGRRPIDPSADSAHWDALLKAAGLPDVKGHSTRHTCNTILTELGVPVDVRQKILGHASRAVNEQVYTHTSDARTAEAMRAIGTTLDWRSV